jgi:hypothetical protein
MQNFQIQPGQCKGRTWKGCPGRRLQPCTDGRTTTANWTNHQKGHFRVISHLLLALASCSMKPGFFLGCRLPPTFTARLAEFRHPWAKGPHVQLILSWDSILPTPYMFSLEAQEDDWQQQLLLRDRHIGQGHPAHPSAGAGPGSPQWQSSEVASCSVCCQQTVHVGRWQRGSKKTGLLQICIL